MEMSIVQYQKIETPKMLEIKNSSILEGDALNILNRLPSNLVQCAVTSPPYWGLRDYNIEGQIGLEPTLQQFINHLVSVFTQVRRILKDEGVLWLNIGDGYTSGNRGWRAPDKKNPARAMNIRPDTPEGLKPKDLIGIPWKLAFALQEDGWYLRSDIVWYKPNAMPESVKDRPTRAHEYIFLLTKSEKYYYDYQAIMEESFEKFRNKRSVWSINTQPFPNSHFATFPTTLIEPCIIAGSREQDFVLDPFFGSGTVGLVCQRYNRRFIGVELNPDYVLMASERLRLDKDNIIRVA
jgi:site-specific DNA-methyltransferase (cytosine-N4-specific)